MLFVFMNLALNATLNLLQSVCDKNEIAQSTKTCKKLVSSTKKQAWQTGTGSVWIK